MPKEKTIYDLLIAIIPSILIGIISIISIIYSNRKQENSQITNVRMNKIEKLYEKLCTVNGMIIEEKKKYEYDTEYYISPSKLSEILKNIESLKVEAKLYFTMNLVESLSVYTEILLHQMLHKKNDKEEKSNLKDGEYDEDEGQVFAIVPSTFQQMLSQYENVFNSVENQIMRISHRILGYKLPKPKLGKYKKKSLRHPWLRLFVKKQKSTSA
jgi:hypothetical protein